MYTGAGGDLYEELLVTLENTLFCSIRHRMSEQEANNSRRPSLWNPVCKQAGVATGRVTGMRDDLF